MVKTVNDYKAWVTNRMNDTTAASSVEGHETVPLNENLFDHQEYLVRWALGRGRAAVFADTGLGKTIVQLEWARIVAERAGRVLILAPLAVADQTVAEADRFGVPGVRYLRHDDHHTHVSVTNYEMMDHFDPADFAGIVLDESSILKSFTGSFRNRIIEAYAHTPFRLACTATPAPNDFTEIGNHSEFLGIKSRVEMLAEYFINDTGDTTSAWRLKGHAQDAFWRWLAGWSRVIKHPADLGFSADGYDLPPLNVDDVVVTTDNVDAADAGMLFLPQAMTLSEQRAVRKATLPKRVKAIREIDAADHDAPLVVWCEYNAEADAITEALDGAVQVAGADDIETKRERLFGFASGKYRVMVTKPSIAGFGMNWQHCNRVVFAGASHSYEKTYQAIRRCWRFGQTRPVTVTVIRSDREHSVWANYTRKERDAERLSEGMIEAMKAEVAPAKREWNKHEPQTDMELPSWM